MPDIRQATAGSADATPGGRTLIDSESPGARPSAAARGRVTRTGQASAAAAGEASVEPFTIRQLCSASELPMSEMPRGGLPVAPDRRRLDADQEDVLHIGKPADIVGEPCRIGDRQARGQSLAAHDADVEAGAVQQVGERQQEPSRQEQHVEQQRPDHRHAGDGQQRPGPVALRGAPGEGERRHR